MSWQRKDTDLAYLQPYMQAARRHGGGFGSLLWASQQTQQLRFAVLSSLYNCHHQRLLDVGAGRGDLLAYLHSQKIRPAHYYAVEAVEPLAAEIERRGFDDCTVIRADFVREPHRLFVGADVVIFSGSLNTLSPQQAYHALRRGYEAATKALVFNFLCAPTLAAASHLYWHPRGEMESLVRTLSSKVTWREGYLEGDCTACVCREPHARESPRDDAL